MIDMDDYIKALSLECLHILPSFVKRNEWNKQICEAIDELDEGYKGASSKSERVEVLSRAYDLCLMVEEI